MAARTIIVSNRLPVKVKENNGTLEYQSSEGGLATGLGCIYNTGDNIWIGWPGTNIPEPLKNRLRNDFAEKHLHPIFLTEEEIQNYYEGFSNETLWPLYHYFPSYSIYNCAQWDTYKAVNQKFADAVLDIARDGDTIWIHDYQLTLAPAMIREKMPHCSIGFFQHIPFPSFEVFRALPWKEEMVNGLLGADVIGFHTGTDRDNYINTVKQLTGKTVIANEIRLEDRKVTVDAFPIGVDYKKFNSLAKSAGTERALRKIQGVLNCDKILASVDRLDYSKGIIQRLQAYRLLLQQHPELITRVKFVQLVVPSRDTVLKYKELKEEVDRLVGEINAQYTTFDWQPIHYFYRSFDEELLTALYRVADVALVTPLRDGMNLVCKEYIACRVESNGVLLLSEMAGAAKELSEAILINPNDISDFASKIYAAIVMPEDEQKKRMLAMQKIVSTFDIQYWTTSFLNKLNLVKYQQLEFSPKELSTKDSKELSVLYKNAHRRLLVLGYDGVIAPYSNKPAQATPDIYTLQLLTAIVNDKHNSVVLISGRPHAELEKWFGKLPVDLVAEHGAWQKKKGGTWTCNSDTTINQFNDIIRTMSAYTSRTPGSFIEEKSNSVSWHYRNTHELNGNANMKLLLTDLQQYTMDNGLSIIQGDKVIEVKSAAVNKGRPVKNWLKYNLYDFILAIGKDNTDEDIFQTLPAAAITIKVGNEVCSSAMYVLSSYKDVRRLLLQLSVNRYNTDEVKLLQKAV